METSNERKAGALILSQIAMFNEAAVLFENVVQPIIFKNIDNTVEDFCKRSNNNWDGEFDFHGINGCWFARKEWKLAESENDFEPIAWFAIDSVKKAEEDYWTAIICNESKNGNEAGFKFYVNSSIFGGKQWQQHMSNLDQETIDKLTDLGFQKIGNKTKEFFIPFHLNPESLASSYEDPNDLEYEHAAFDPIRETLKKIDDSFELFQQIISQAPKVNC